VKKLDVNDCSFAHLTAILLLHSLVKCRRRSLVVYNNECMPGSICMKLGIMMIGSRLTCDRDVTINWFLLGWLTVVNCLDI